MNNDERLIKIVNEITVLNRAVNSSLIDGKKPINTWFSKLRIKIKYKFLYYIDYKIRFFLFERKIKSNNFYLHLKFYDDNGSFYTIKIEPWLISISKIYTKFTKKSENGKILQDNEFLYKHDTYHTSIIEKFLKKKFYHSAAYNMLRASSLSEKIIRKKIKEMLSEQKIDINGRS